MPVWRDEVSIDGVGATLPAATLFPTFQGAYAGASYALACKDGTNLLTVKMNLIHDRELNGAAGANAYVSRMTAGATFSTSPDPYNLFKFESAGGQFRTTTSDAGAAFNGGGILAIEKDTSTGDVRFTTPLATWSTTAGFLGISSSTQLRPWSVGLLLQAQDISPATNADQSLTVDFSHLAGKQDGTQITGALMSTGDPGSWSAWAESALFSSAILPTFTQLSATERAKLVYPATATPGGGAVVDGWYREWTGADVTPMTGGGLDLVSLVDHAIVFGGWAVPTATTILRVRRSHDFGHSWTDYDAVSDGHIKAAVSLAVFAGVVYAVYDDGTVDTIKQTVSYDLGLSWSTPVAVSITGTNPRLVIAPDGPFFYFYISSGSILLQRSFDLGSTLFDVTPIPVASGVPMQDFAAIYAADRSLVVAYAVGSSWFTRRSLDYGDTWFAA